MDYNEALAYLLEIPMFQNVGGAAYNPGLEKIEAFCSYLGLPQKKFRVIHVAGTNGKGSVSHMVASVLQSCGLKVGLYTSPHIRRLNERVRINGVPIDDSIVAEFVSANKGYMDSAKPSFFEVTTALAFDTFAREQVDIAVVEAGLGGRLDATNVVDPLISVITNISLDHTAILGKTLPEIAFEKAGIIKEGRPVVVGETDFCTAPVFIECATKKSSRIFFADQMYRCDGSKATHCGRSYELCSLLTGYTFGLESDLCGLYQHKNIPTVLSVFEALKELQIMQIERQNIEQGIAHCIAQTGLCGRWQTIGTKPLVVCDIAHNQAGIGCVAEQLKTQTFEQLYIVLGVVNDKAVDDILPLLPALAHYIFTSPPVERAMPCSELASHAKKLGIDGVEVPNVCDALDYALKLATANDMIYIGGSTFTVAEVLKRY